MLLAHTAIVRYKTHQPFGSQESSRHSLVHRAKDMDHFSKNPSRDNREGLLLLYEQSCENARAYMDLRFKHFTTFMFVTGLLGAMTFQVETLRNFKFQFCIVA